MRFIELSSLNHFIKSKSQHFFEQKGVKGSTDFFLQDGQLIFFLKVIIFFDLFLVISI